MKMLALSLSLFILSPVFLLAQSGVVKGQVTEMETGDPVFFASVVLLKNGFAIKGRETNMDGNYVFNSIPAGIYAIEVSYLGFEN